MHLVYVQYFYFYSKVYDKIRAGHKFITKFRIITLYFIRFDFLLYYISRKSIEKSFVLFYYPDYNIEVQDN